MVVILAMQKEHDRYLIQMRVASCQRHYRRRLDDIETEISVLFDVDVGRTFFFAVLVRVIYTYFDSSMCITSQRLTKYTRDLFAIQRTCALQITPLTVQSYGVRNNLV